MSRIRKVTQYLVIVISGCLLFATGTYFLVWKSMGVDPALSAKPLFKDFTPQKKEYLDGGKSDEGKNNNFRVKADGSSAESYCFDIQDLSFCLQIRFSIGDDYSGGGYILKIIRNRYSISPYHHTDNPRAFDFLHEDYYKILNSKVILDKASYKKGG